MAKAKAKEKAPAKAKAPAKTEHDIDPMAPALLEALALISSIEGNPTNRSDGSVAYVVTKGQLDELRALIWAIR